MRPFVKMWLLAGCLVILCGHSFLSRPLPGQTEVPGFDMDDPSTLFTPRDRRQQALLEQARGELAEAEGDHRESLQTLQRIIDDAEDVFADSRMKESLHEEALAILASLPQASRKQYEELFNEVAVSRLNAEEGKPHDHRLEVVRRFFHTEAGATSAFLVATAQVDAGRTLAAARLFDRLRTTHIRAAQFEPELTTRTISSYWRAGADERAAEVLVEAVRQKMDVRWNEQSIPQLDSIASAIAWLDHQLGHPPLPANTARSQWPVAHGLPSRSAGVVPVSPLFDDAWRVPLVRDMDAESPAQVEELATLLEGVTATARDADWLSIPVMTPLVVGDAVVFSSYGLVKAIAMETGALQWVAIPADQTFVDAMATSGGSRTGQMSADMDEFLAQRAWLDATSSQLSSDGEQIYAIRDSGMVGGLPAHFANVAQLNHPRRAKPFNSLRAYDAAGGIWKWEIGGERRRAALPLAGTFFLGPPLPVDGTLYVLGEDLGQVRLHALNPETGAVRWSLPLANADTDIEEELDRRLAGLSPTLAGGLLICPTGSGLVVAVDPLSRSLVWGQRYREPQEAMTMQRFGRGPFMVGPQASRAQQASITELMEQPRWHDACVVASGTSLLLAPPDVAEPDDERRLVCLNLLDGNISWQRGRQESLLIGAVHDQTVLLVGRRQVEGVHVQNGRTLWSIPLGPPSGQGVRSGKLFHLPLASGELATIDMAKGQLLARSPVRSGQPLGNLIAVAGRLISQSATEVRSFRTLVEVERQLADDFAANPDDPAALAVRGELRLHLGETDLGLDDLRASLEQQPDARSQQLLVTTLLEGLRSDFAAYRPHVDELDRLATDAALRSQFLMTYANGLLEAGDLQPAFKQFLRLLAISTADSPLEYVDDGRWVRRDRRVQARLAQLYTSADESIQHQLDESIDAQLKTMKGDAQASLRHRLASAIPSFRRSEDVDDSEVAMGGQAVPPTQVESRLLVARRTADEDERAPIAAELVDFYSKHGRAEPVVQLLKELETAWAETPIREGLTGSEWAKQARESAKISELLNEAVNWPTGDIAVREGAGNTTPFNPLPMEGPFDPLVSNFLFLPDNRGQVAIQDGYGRKVPDGVLRLLPSGESSYQTQYVMQQGHRAVIYLGTQFKLIDLIDGKPHIVLEDSLVDDSLVDATGLRRHQRRVFRQQGFRGPVLWSDDPGHNGSLGPLNDSLFCYLRGRTLHAHDPFTGTRYWTVEDAPANAEIFADDDYVLVVPIGQNAATVYRALDGGTVGVRGIPADVVRDRRDADWGRLFLRITDDSVAMYDPVAQENVWERSMSAPFKWAPLDGRNLCLVTDKGRMTLVNAQTGAVLLEKQVDVPEQMLAAHVLSLPDLWLLATYRRPAADADAQLAPVQIPDSTFRVNGPVTAFDRPTGKVMWSRVIANQMITPDLPSRWPVLSLSAVVQATPQIEGQRVVPVLVRRIELINRQTGETIHSATTDGNTRRIDNYWHISESEPQLRLRYGFLELEVSFRQAAADVPPEPAEEADQGTAPDDPSPPDNSPSKPADDSSPDGPSEEGG